MYTKDLYSKFTLRLNPVQNEFIKDMAATMDMTPSEYVRQLIDIARFGCYNSLPLDVSADEGVELYGTDW